MKTEWDSSKSEHSQIWVEFEQYNFHFSAWIIVIISIYG